MTGFTIPLAKLAEKVKSDLNTTVQKSTQQVFDAVVKKSPVDTGRFRANWNVSKDAVNAATTDSTSAARATEEVNKALTIEAGGVVYLANGLPYARPLEYGLYPDPVKQGTYVPKGKIKGGVTGPGYVQLSQGGYSKQAPAGMVRLSAQEFGDYVQRVIKK